MVNDVMPLMEEGIEPANKLKLIFRVLKFVKALIVSGIGPINLLEVRLN